jgi:hypothetical protein
LGGSDLTGFTGPWHVPTTTHTVTQQDQSQNTSYTQTITDSKAGWLSFTNLQPFVAPPTHTESTKVSSSVSTATTVGTSVADGSSFFAVGDAFGYEQFYDTVFSTYLYLPTVASTQTASSPQAPGPAPGPASGPAGQSAPNALVMLEIGNKKYFTRANAQGRYAFHVPIPQGSGFLTADNVRVPVQIRAPQALR